MKSVTFFAAGIPAQQGSKRAVGNGRFVEVNPHVKSWRSVVAAACPMEAPLDCPVRLILQFRYPRPRSHYHKRKNGLFLREDAPTFKSTAPDLDKLVRCVGDALTGVAFTDDKLIACLEATKIFYLKTSGVAISIYPLPA